MQYWINKAHRLGNTIRYHLATVAFLLGAALLIATAIGFSIAGGYLWLSMQLPGYQAAFIVAGVLCLLGGIVIILATRRSGDANTASRASEPHHDTEAEAASEQIMRTALTATMATPIKAIVAATVMGFVVGLLRAKK